VDEYYFAFPPPHKSAVETQNKKIIVTAQANWFLWMFGRISSQTSIKATPAEQ
jgi:hypothetical protein